MHRGKSPGNRVKTSAPRTSRRATPTGAETPSTSRPTAIERGYSDNRWGTYKQIQAAGGYVRKGEKGTPARWLSYTLQKPVKDKQGKPVKDAEGKQVYRQVELERPFAKRFTVYNVEQTEKLNLPDRQERQAAWKTHDAAERVIRASGVDFRHQSGDRASYQMRTDRVTMPERAQFPDADRYYQTAMHELGHATGHRDRLNRETLQDAVKSHHGSHAYAREELRAEIAGMMTNTRLGVGHNPRHGAAYITSWVKDLKEHPKEIRSAASAAERMSSYLIDRGRELGEKDKAQAKAAAPGARAPELQYEKTGPNRWQYRQGERTATVTRPSAQEGTTREARLHTEKQHYLVTMKASARAGTLTAWAKDAGDADQKARQYAATGEVPQWSEQHHDATGPRHQATPEKTSSPRADRDDGPSR